MVSNYAQISPSAKKTRLTCCHGVVAIVYIPTGQFLDEFICAKVYGVGRTWQDTSQPPPRLN